MTSRPRHAPFFQTRQRALASVSPTSRCSHARAHSQVALAWPHWSLSLSTAPRSDGAGVPSAEVGGGSDERGGAGGERDGPPLPDAFDYYLLPSELAARRGVPAFGAAEAEQQQRGASAALDEERARFAPAQLAERFDEQLVLVDGIFGPFLKLVTPEKLPDARDDGAPTLLNLSRVDRGAGGVGASTAPAPADDADALPSWLCDIVPSLRVVVRDAADAARAENQAAPDADPRDTDAHADAVRAATRAAQLRARERMIVESLAVTEARARATPRTAPAPESTPAADADARRAAWLFAVPSAPVWSVHADFDAALRSLLGAARASVVLLLAPATMAGAEDYEGAGGFAHDVLQHSSADAWGARLLARLRRSLGEARARRVLLVPPLAPRDYVAVLGMCDAAIEPFPVGSLGAALDAFESSIPIVTAPAAQRSGARAPQAPPSAPFSRTLPNTPRPAPHVSRT